MNLVAGALTGCAALALLAGWLYSAPGAHDPIAFEDTASRAGVDFVLRNSANGERRQIETMVSGVAVFDYNNDGWPDIYFVNGAQQPKLEKSDPSFYNRLYKNNGDGTFTDVTAAAGVRGAGFAMGVTAADYDNDGAIDLFIAGVNRNILYRNRGDGTFEDVTQHAGLAFTGPGTKPWSVSAGWFDYDNDGLLDLFVVNYVAWAPEKDPPCTIGKRRTYCHPKYYEGLPNELYHNNGDGTFTNTSVSSGIASHIGKGMGLAFLDYDLDGKLDVFVANDTVPNFLFHNEGGGRFRQAGLQAGVAFNEDGRALSSMGVSAGDVDNDGREDLWVAANGNETFPLFRNLGKGLLMDVTYPSGIGRQTMTATGWSNGIFDFNNDGQKDLFAACGAIDDNTETFSSRQSKQANKVLVNLGGLHFLDVSASAGKDFQQVGAHRGAAFGDFDRDGRVDAVVSRIGERAEVFHNVSPVANHWLAIQLHGRKSNREGIGSLIHLVSASGTEQWNRVTTTTGYGGSSDRTVFFGLGKEASAKWIEISWPGGVRQRIDNPKTDRYVTIDEP
ncbi:MAG: CRTAC1 family protein [Bryobacteraceae bacterium]